MNLISFCMHSTAQSTTILLQIRRSNSCRVTTRKAEPIISDPPQWLVADTLVIYVYSDTDPEYRGNLEFFVRHGMWERDGCDYLIIIQQVPSSVLWILVTF